DVLIVFMVLLPFRFNALSLMLRGSNATQSSVLFQQRTGHPLGLSTRHYEKTAEGLPIRSREPLQVSIPPSFPLREPKVWSSHKRFAGYPHVQWARYLCLYLAPDIEWVPSDGMYGFVDRLNSWFAAAAKGELDPIDGPLHPPVVYKNSNVQIVIRADTPEFEQDASHWIGTAELSAVHETRFDLVSWKKLDEKPADELTPAAAILLSQPFPIEYPKNVNGIVGELEKNGIDVGTLYLLMRYHTSLLQRDQKLYIVLGTPMRRRDPNGPILQHLAVWRIDDEATNALRKIIAETEDKDAAIGAFAKWSLTAEVEWCRIDEARQQVTHPRDGNSVAAWVKDKRVLLLGCGALGSYTADFLARGGARQIKLVDKDSVSSGVISRQQFTDSDIGKLKSNVLKDRLKAISPNCEVTAEFNNLTNRVLPNDIGDIDLIIDTTASRSVGYVLERELQVAPNSPPIIGMSISAKAEYGQVIYRPPSFPGGPRSLSRNAKLTAYRNPKYKDLAKTFWPKPGDIELFQPEPGCSEPTFEGSAADIAFHASGLLNMGLCELVKDNRTVGSCSYQALPLVEDNGSIGRIRFGFESPTQNTERNHSYLALTATAARKTIESEIERSARVNGECIETGGLLFGEIDDYLERISVDQASGPPPDSKLTEKLFVCGTDGTQELSKQHKKISGGSSGFIGIWHTHPVSPPDPSNIDLGAMQSILHLNDKPPRHIVMLIIGQASTNPQWAYYLFRRNELRWEQQVWRVIRIVAHA
uniref:ThiF family adenylyltransferase n=1 Tax=Nitratireductor sp. XY-223 TaxID=2561926 RepID=UPI0010AB238C